MKEFLCYHLMNSSRCYWSYPADGSLHGLILRHEFIQEHLERVDPHLHGWLAPVSLLHTHRLLQDVLKQCVQILITDAFTIIHLVARKKERKGRRKCKSSLSGSISVFKIFLVVWQQWQSKRGCQTHSEGSGVRVEDVDPEFLQRFLKNNIHHGVLFTIFRIKIGNLRERSTAK